MEKKYKETYWENNNTSSPIVLDNLLHSMPMNNNDDLYSPDDEIPHSADPYTRPNRSYDRPYGDISPQKPVSPYQKSTAASLQKLSYKDLPSPPPLHQETCLECKHPIHDDEDAFEIDALKAWFHADCFCCVVCKRVFDDNNPFVPHNGITNT